MKTLRFTIVFLLFTVPLEETRGYENTPTHESITTWGVQLAAVDGYAEVRALKDVIVQGAVEEDDMPRFANHFWDPDATGANGLPQNSYTCAYMRLAPCLGTRFTDALTWARDGMPDDLDWYAAIDAYGYTVQARGRAYLALGHTVHLLQDMAQPDHATNRPHPGGHTHEQLAAWFGEAFAEFVVATDTVAYETLWVLNDQTWPRGKQAKKFESLEAAFKDLATKSKAAEAPVRSRFEERGELALGLGALKVENPLLQGVVAADRSVRRAMHLPSLKGALNQVQFHKFRDRLWRHFESEIPLKPLIPWPAQADTHAYLDLGNVMLPLAEEHGAGLMQLFHDIVNHPPIVQSVIILQDGKEMYHKEWQDEPEGRTLHTVVDTPLEPGALAEIRMTFGPSRVNPELQEPIDLGNLGISLETGRNQWTGIPGRVVSGPNEAVTWNSDEFIVQKAGTLVITAKDTHAHFERREHNGDVLDANPATYALAKSPAPFNWVGYEPGKDRNHALRLATPEGCPIGRWSADRLKTLQSGTWRGTVTRQVYDIPYIAESRAELTFRSLAVVHPWQLEDILITNFFLTFGGAQGHYVTDVAAHVDSPAIHQEGEVGVSGTLVLNPPEGTEHHEYGFRVGLLTPPGADPATSVAYDAIISGYDFQKACADGTLAGTWNFDDFPRAKTTWSFTYTPDLEPPPHVKPTLDLGHHEPEGMNRFNSFVMTTLTPAFQLPEAVQPLTDAWMETVNRYTALRYPAMQEIQQKITDLHKEAGELWLTEEPLRDDGKYEAKVAALEAAVRDWWDKREEADEIYASGAERLAEMVEAKHPKTAEALREAARKIREKGSDRFGVGE